MGVSLRVIVEPVEARDHVIERLAVVRRRVLLLHLAARERIIRALEDVADLVLRVWVLAVAQRRELEVERRCLHRRDLVREIRCHRRLRRWAIVRADVREEHARIARHAWNAQVFLGMRGPAAGEHGGQRRRRHG
ncbi:MAG: hypothetical protein AB7L94_09505 [Kofleriaceae bacterium]